MLITSRPRGTKDILPDESGKWQYLESLARDTCRRYAYKEARSPIFEHTELFMRGVGDTTDVVEKQMFTFNDRGGRSMTLRPECTTSMVRMYLEEGIHAAPQPTKIYYIGPMFRHENPQAGRYRQFNQFGLEVFGSVDPAVDAEVIVLAVDYLHRLNLNALRVELNNIGCPECRTEYREKLKTYFREYLTDLCDDCRNRLERNPLRIFDCKNEKCAQVAAKAPLMNDALCGNCADHFSKVQEYLTQLGIDYTINPKLVRGLDYYTKTVFEIVSTDLGAQNTLCGGGRYDGLIELCGGDPTPGIGFAMGMERILLVLEKQGFTFPPVNDLDIFLVTMGEDAKKAAVSLADGLRKQGYSVDIDYLNRSIKGQMKYANKMGAKTVAIIGSDELAAGAVSLKDMLGGTQIQVAFVDIGSKLGELLGGRDNA